PQMSLSDILVVTLRMVILNGGGRGHGPFQAEIWRMREPWGRSADS
ncbi:MAG: hypothetical protein ACJA0P_003711, partial [Planctomycetota bacterium]